MSDTTTHRCLRCGSADTRKATLFWQCLSCGHDWLEPACVICGEPGADAEMHDAAMLADPELFSEAESGLVHAECGLAKGWAVS